MKTSTARMTKAQMAARIQELEEEFAELEDTELTNRDLRQEITTLEAGLADLEDTCDELRGIQGDFYEALEAIKSRVERPSPMDEVMEPDPLEAIRGILATVDLGRVHAYLG